MKQIFELQKKLMELTDREIVLSEGYCKSAEPSLSIGIDNELKLWAEIYSYLLDIGAEGGRNYLFEADTLEELYAKLDEAIKYAEASLIRREKKGSDFE